MNSSLYTIIYTAYSNIFDTQEIGSIIYTPHTLCLEVKIFTHGSGSSMTSFCRTVSYIVWKVATFLDALTNIAVEVVNFLKTFSNKILYYATLPEASIGCFVPRRHILRCRFQLIDFRLMRHSSYRLLSCRAFSHWHSLKNINRPTDNDNVKNNKRPYFIAGYYHKKAEHSNSC